MVRARVGAVWKRTRAGEPWLLDAAFVVALFLIYVHLRVFFLFCSTFSKGTWTFLSYLGYGAGLDLGDMIRGTCWLAAGYFLVSGIGHAVNPATRRSITSYVARIGMVLMCVALAASSAFVLSNFPPAYSRAEAEDLADDWFVERGSLADLSTAVRRDFPGAVAVSESLLTDDDPTRRLYGAVLRYDLDRRVVGMRRIIRGAMAEIEADLASGAPVLSDAQLRRVVDSLRSLERGAIRESSLQRTLRSERERILEYLRARLLPWWRENAERFVQD